MFRIVCAIWWTVEGSHVILLLLSIHTDWQANQITKERWGKVEQNKNKHRHTFKGFNSGSCALRLSVLARFMVPSNMFWGWEPVHWLDGATAARAHLREGCIPLKTAGTAASTGLAIAEWSQTARCSAAGKDCWTAECPYHPNQLTLFELVTSTNWPTACFHFSAWLVLKVQCVTFSLSDDLCIGEV